MLTRYIQAAMRDAKYEMLDDKTFYGFISGFEGVWANESTLEACRQELQDVLEDWILLGVSLNHELPIVNGIELKYSEDRSLTLAAR
jgi:predicted RNase H-like HicB family nuclease